MIVQVVTFNLDGLNDQDYRDACEHAWAQPLATVPGLCSKLWLADTDANTYGGVYLWEQPSDAERFAQSEFFRTFAADPRIRNLNATTFSLLEEPTRVTHGLPALVR